MQMDTVLRCCGSVGHKLTAKWSSHSGSELGFNGVSMSMGASSGVVMLREHAADNLGSGQS